jgi:multidrug resistance efflux pump
MQTMDTHNEKKIRIFRRPWFQSLVAVVIIFGTLGGYLYWQSVAGVVYIEKSYLEAPIAYVSPFTPGILNAIYVHEGDRVNPSSAIALVGSETLYAKEEGIIDGVPKVVGSYFAPGQKIASVIADTKMRLVASVEETGGLDSITIGQRVTFTVDAFPKNTYEGTVAEISPASSETGIAFSISDKRPVKKFNVYITFNVSAYPELKTGMSARTWIYTQ